MNNPLICDSLRLPPILHTLHQIRTLQRSTAIDFHQQQRRTVSTTTVKPASIKLNHVACASVLSSKSHFCRQGYPCCCVLFELVFGG
ncbi:hypothetical protein RYX36_022679 [Vicia faba]